MANGAISFDKVEVKFNLNDQGEPEGVYFKISKDANHLIEEFMLLANKKLQNSSGNKRKPLCIESTMNPMKTSSSTCKPSFQSLVTRLISGQERHFAIAQPAAQ
jgi:exoribonuclease R